MKIELTMRPDEGDTVTLIQPYLGMGPFALLQVRPDQTDAEDGMRLTVDTGGGIPQSAADLAAFLRDVADYLDDIEVEANEAVAAVLVDSPSDEDGADR